MKYLIFTCLIFMTFNCKNNNTETETDVNLDALILNQGKPWIVNNETHIGITKMDSLITKFAASKGQNYTLLGESLSKQTSYIIKNCSMKGTAHDQLHVVLVPMLDDISVMKEVNDIRAKKTALLKLQIYIEQYFKHFTTE
ncbi:hypothetical protein [Flavivirga rizhaonensis]|uniref:Uncharacterized protein n=1 Tax=Flavivirga rizhaonensis TaxID=2559571 RepID=A0A4S1DXT7_9FLAO|nr:hypothetical protein [Flavivirga rizhaonensis]TGV02342.1 hypothetical protein EM932_11415 [Flavivirga rizhaonensis]